MSGERYLCTDGARFPAACLETNRARLLFLASENIRTGAAPVSYLFRWPKGARREALFVVKVSVCFRRGPSRGETVSVRDIFVVEINLLIGGLANEIVDFASLYLDGVEMVVGSDK